MANWSTGVHNALNPQLLDRISPFIKNLFAMEPRIRVCGLYGDIEDDKGYFVTKSNIFIPYELPKIEHDLSHLLELRNSKRWTLPDWGMPRFNDDTIKPGPLFAALCRETRTRAIQLHLMPDAIGDEKNTTFNQLANPYWASMTERFLPYGRFKSMQDVKCWMGDMRERTYNAWCLDRITHEWKVRLNHIQNWMETA
jgi:hypothetical protein